MFYKIRSYKQFPHEFFHCEISGHHFYRMLIYIVHKWKENVLQVLYNELFQNIHTNPFDTSFSFLFPGELVWNAFSLCLDRNEKNHILNIAALCQNDGLSCAETCNDDLWFCNRIGHIPPSQSFSTYFLFAVCDTLWNRAFDSVSVHLKRLGLSHLVSEKDLDSPLYLGDTSLKYILLSMNVGRHSVEKIGDSNYF